MSTNSPIEAIDEFPLPLDRESVIDMQVSSVGDPYGLESYAEVETTVDGFHERYVDELVRTSQWVFFRNWWGGVVNHIYAWNHAAGYGFKFDADWEVACSLIDAMDAFTDEYESSDFEPNLKAWETP